MPKGSIHWQGTQRRACAPGAHWNVQVVRGKVTTRCLWHACKALGIGLLLMLLGTCMATIGYYADQLSVAQEVRGNLTVKVKNESRGFHLNNLSYAGPIVMGVGGFIVVAACVMTFEARDSAAKVVPARFRFNQNTPIKTAKSQRSRRSTSCQTSRWDHQLGLFRVNRSPSPSLHDASRKQLTADLMKFSRNLHDKRTSHPIKKSPSAPSLIEKRSPRRRAPKYSGCALLNPKLLQRPLSVDHPGYSPKVSRESLENQKMSGSQVSMAMDLHIPNKGPVTLKIKDRSDTARRHQLLRQTKVEDEEVEIRKRSHSCSPKLQGYTRYPDDFLSRKRNSVDLLFLEDLEVKRSPRDIRKTTSPNIRKMSLDRIAGERRLERNLGHRKSSFDFRRSPDFRRGDYRKYSIDRFTADCAKYVAEEVETRSRAHSGESVRKQRRPRLYHSKSDDNRRRSFDKNRRDSQASRYSLNTQVVHGGCAPEYELKYFTATSLDTEESRADNSDDSHVVEIDENTAITAASDGPAETEALLEEPELENLTEIDAESSVGDLDDLNEDQFNESGLNTVEVQVSEILINDTEPCDTTLDIEDV